MSKIVKICIMNCKTLYSKSWFGSYEELNQMPRLVFRVLCAFLFDNSYDLGISEDYLPDLLSAPYSTTRGLVCVRTILKSLDVTGIMIEKQSVEGVVRYRVELRRLSSGFTVVS